MDFLRYAATLGTVFAFARVLVLLQWGAPGRDVFLVSMVLGCAWFGGLGPALLISPLLLFHSRLENGRWDSMDSHDVTAFTVITVVATSASLAGRYQRRVQAVKKEHARKLTDQARALSHAHIVFRDVHGRVTQWNEGAEKMFGWTESEAVGRPLHELLRTEFSTRLEEINIELLYTGQWQGEVIHYHKDGAALNIAAHWILYRDNQGASIGVAEVHNDVSALRRAEEAVREADRRKDEFLAMLAHELRNPLAPIRTGLELMKMVKDDPQTMEETRAIMERQTKQLVALVDDLLDVSRITRGKLELRKCRVKLSDVVQSAVEAAQPFIEDGGHELSVIVPDRPLYLNADPHRLAQVLSNLLNNSAKYTREGGDIVLSADRRGSDVVVSVKDSGVGIPADMRERIFEMFTQIDRSMEKTHSGLGIGLTLAKSIVEMHGGTIEVHSDGANRGTTFRVILPLLLEIPAVESPVDPVEMPTPKERRVLIVDDNQAAASLLSSVVKMLGNEVRTAGDGEEAIAMADDFRPDVILMDLGMPKLNGYDAARHIRQQPWGRKMLLVALTGWGQDGDKQRTKEAGFDHHLVKPADPAELQNLLAEPKVNGDALSMKSIGEPVDRN